MLVEFCFFISVLVTDMESLYENSSSCDEKYTFDLHTCVYFDKNLNFSYKSSPSWFSFLKAPFRGLSESSKEARFLAPSPHISLYLVA